MLLSRQYIPAVPTRFGLTLSGVVVVLMTPSLTSSLARFAATLQYSDIPAAGVAICRAAIIDGTGCMLAGSAEPAARIVRTFLADQSCAARASIIGCADRTSPTGAAMANGTSGHALDYDDVNQPMIGHPTVTLLPALFAAGEITNATGADIITAYVIGLDAQARLGRLINPGHFAHGWHPTSTLGPLGAAIAAGRLLGLDERQLRHALGIAASGAGGLRKNFGSMVKPYHAGQAAERGLAAALLAAGGLDADPDVLDGPHGFLQTFCGHAPQGLDVESVRFGVDQPLEIIRSGVGLKLHACCGCSHTALDVVLDLAAEHGIDAADVDQVECNVNAQAHDALVHHHATTGLQGKFSMEYSVAVALLDGMTGPRQFDDERARQADVDALQRRVVMRIDPAIAVRHGTFPSRVVIRLRDGRLLTGYSDKARGTDPALPLSEAQVDAKFRGCASGTLGARATEDALTLLRDFERLANLQALMRAVTSVA